jgi:peroxiredoxin
MTLRSLFVFIHVVSAMGVFGALAIEGALLLRLRHAAGTADMLDALKGFRLLGVLASLSLASTVMSGMYLVRTVWGWRAAWINVAFASLVLAVVAGVTTTALRVAQLRSTEGGGLDQSIGQAGYARDPILSVSFVMRTAIFTGIVFLMTGKPGLEESLVGIGAATAVGVLANLTILRAATIANVPSEKRLIAGRDSSPEKSMKASREYCLSGGHSMSATAPVVHATRQLNVGDTVARRTLAAVSEELISIPDSQRLVHLQFRRFAGCPVCNLHLQSFSRRHREITAAGVCEVIVFHSKADDLRPYATDLPFAVIAGPDKRLYLEFGVESSPRALLDPRAWPSILRGIIHSFVSIVWGKQPVPSLIPEGGRFGLPADFLIALDGHVLARKYGIHADDHWSVEEVLTLVRDAAPQAHAVPSSHKRSTLALLLAALSILPMLSRAAASPSRAFLDVQIPFVPAVATVDGQQQLVYEADITNSGSTPVTLTRIDVRRESGGVMRSYEGAELESSLAGASVSTATTNLRELRPGRSVTLFVWLAIDRAPVVRISHKISFRTSDGSAASIDVAATTVRTQRQLALSPPLGGGPWVAVYDPDLKNGHRRVRFALDGKARIPARFAIDWFKLGPNGRFTHDDPSLISNSYSYGEDVFAVGDGVVVALEERLPEPTPDISIDNEAGNYIALDLGGGRFAFYEHLKARSIRVQLNERVRAGQVLGAVGASGSVSSGAHLHFHIADANAVLAAEGIPFVLRTYRQLGSFPSLEALSRPWARPAAGATPTPHVMDIPAPLTVLRFDR